MKNLVVALVFGLVFGGATTRASAAPAFQAVDCAHADDQASMNICAEQRFKAADAKLNAAYHALFAKVNPATRIQLQAAQQAWLAYRNAECTFETAATIDGSIHPMIVAGCLESMTRAQTKRLDAMLHCADGDLSCVTL
jgi:uncharacterized protein YecT (DUF1311 family)